MMQKLASAAVSESGPHHVSKSPSFALLICYRLVSMT